MRSRGLLLAGAAIVLLGQTTADRYAPLKNALGLTDSPPWQLNQAQQAKLTEIAKVFDRTDMAAGAIVLGLLDRSEWQGTMLCYYPVRSYAKEFGLGNSQVSRFEELQQMVREPFASQINEKLKAYSELTRAGWGAQSPQVVQLMSEVSDLRAQAQKVIPMRERLGLLNDAQRAKLAAFQADLELAREALELHLIPEPSRYEMLCH